MADQREDRDQGREERLRRLAVELGQIEDYCTACDKPISEPGDCAGNGPIEQRPTVAFLNRMRAHDDAVRSEAESRIVQRYHILLQNAYAAIDPGGENEELCEAIVAALEKCPPACAHPECEAEGYRKGFEAAEAGKREAEERGERLIREARNRADRIHQNWEDAMREKTAAEERARKAEEELHAGYEMFRGHETRLEAEVAQLRGAAAKQNEEISQALGRVLGYPWFKDDQRSFPGATEGDGVCVGPHTAESLAMEAAERVKELEKALREVVDLQGPWHDEDCSMDDTCDCSAKPLHDMINAALQGTEPRLPIPEPDGPLPSDARKMSMEGTEPQPEDVK